MDLLPYHRFANCGRLERVVTRLNDGGMVPADLLAGHLEHHYAVVHKLKSARRFLDNLDRYVSEEVTEGSEFEENFHLVNFYFDGFANTVGSALDIFAHEMLHYFAVPIPTLLYFHNLENLVATAHPGDPACAFLTEPPWRDEFRRYRNATTHRIVVAKELNLIIRLVGNKKNRVPRFGLPDDPADADSPCTRNTDIVKYCKTTYERCLTFISRAYGHLATRASAAGHLPLP